MPRRLPQYSFAHPNKNHLTSKATTPPSPHRIISKSSSATPLSIQSNNQAQDDCITSFAVASVIFSNYNGYPREPLTAGSTNHPTGKARVRAFMQRSSKQPQGRKELLLWLNGLCNSKYPAVESLRDGAAYCTIIEAAVNRIAKNLKEADVPQAAPAQERAIRAASSLNRLDWSATAVVCENVDPSLDSMAIRKTCRENMTILQEMLRTCVLREHTQQIDVERLSTGKLQDHMRFLQWLHQFMNKALMQYSKAAIEKKSAHRAGEVEGVKLNRAQILLEQKRKVRNAREVPEVPRRRGPSVSPDAPVSARGQPHTTPRADSTPAQRHVDPAAPSAPSYDRSSSATLPRRSSEVLTHAAKPARADPGEDDMARPTPPPAQAAVTFAGGEGGGFSYSRGALVVPADFKDALVCARQEVEELEALVAEAHEQHLATLTHSPDAQDALEENEADEASAGARLLAAGRGGRAESPSLHELGRLLEERDALAQVYAAVDGIVRAHHARGVPSQLLTDLCAILYP